MTPEFTNNNAGCGSGAPPVNKERMAVVTALIDGEEVIVYLPENTVSGVEKAIQNIGDRGNNTPFYAILNDQIIFLPPTAIISIKGKRGTNP